MVIFVDKKQQEGKKNKKRGKTCNKNTQLEVKRGDWGFYTTQHNWKAHRQVLQGLTYRKFLIKNTFFFKKLFVCFAMDGR